MTGMMEGIRIVDLTWGMAGQQATMLPCDHGAQVIRVEPPSSEPIRTPASAVWNRGKQAVTLDLKDETDKARFIELCSGADVLIESFSPGTMDRLGLGYAELSARFPRLIYVSITGYGRGSARENEPAYESLVDAWFGQHYEQQGWRIGEPHYNAYPAAAFGAASLAAIGMLAALRARSITGRGQWVETSLADGLAGMKTMWWGETERRGPHPMNPDPRSNMFMRHLMCLGPMKCGDGKYIQVHSGQPGRFQRAMEYLGLADKISPSNPPHEKATPLSAEEKAFLEAEVPRLVSLRPRAEWLKVFEELDIAALEIEAPGVVLNDPQTIHNRAFAITEDPVLGAIKTVGLTVSSPQVPAPALRPAPSGTVSTEVPQWSPRPGVMSADSHGSLAHPMQGLRVLDFGAFFAGPYAARLMSDLGADVIKIEPPEGDPMRAVSGPFRGAMRGKRSIALDLKSPEGLAIAQDLIRSADVVCHNMRTGVAERIGIGYEQVKQLNPGVIYVNLPGWGSSGPKAHLASFAPLPSGLCGLLIASAGMGNVPVQTVTNEDFFNGMSGAIGALMGLHYRQRTGQGMLIESSLLNSLLFATAYVIMSPDDKPVYRPELDSGQHGYSPLDRLYRTADGWICICVLQDREWQALRGVIAGLPERADDGLAEALASWFAARTAAEALAQLKPAGVPCEQPRKLANNAFVRDEENVRFGRVSIYGNDHYGAMREVAQLIRFSETPGAERWPTVAKGEQGAEILAELGYAAARIADLKERRVVHWEDAAPAAAA